MQEAAVKLCFYYNKELESITQGRRDDQQKKGNLLVIISLCTFELWEFSYPASTFFRLLYESCNYPMSLFSHARFLSPPLCGREPAVPAEQPSRWWRWPRTSSGAPAAAHKSLSQKKKGFAKKSVWVVLPTKRPDDTDVREHYFILRWISHLINT